MKNSQKSKIIIIIIIIKWKVKIPPEYQTWKGKSTGACSEDTHSHNGSLL